MKWETSYKKTRLENNNQVKPTKNEQLVDVAHGKQESKKVWVFMCWAALQTSVSSPCAFEALTCVLFSNEMINSLQNNQG